VRPWPLSPSQPSGLMRSSPLVLASARELPLYDLLVVALAVLMAVSHVSISSVLLLLNTTTPSSLLLVFLFLSESSRYTEGPPRDRVEGGSDQHVPTPSPLLLTLVTRGRAFFAPPSFPDLDRADVSYCIVAAAARDYRHSNPSMPRAVATLLLASTGLLQPATAHDSTPKARLRARA